MFDQPELVVSPASCVWDFRLQLCCASIQPPKNQQHPSVKFLPSSALAREQQGRLHARSIAEVFEGHQPGPSGGAHLSDVDLDVWMENLQLEGDLFDSKKKHKKSMPEVDITRPMITALFMYTS